MNSYKKSIAMSVAAAIIIAASSFAASPISPLQSSYAWIQPDVDPERSQKAPVVVSGNNIYVVWGTDKGTVNKNGELMFRVSTDGGKTFSDKINLSNSTNADAIDQMIDVDENTIAVHGGSIIKHQTYQ
jgi:hypothetical protein